MQKTRKRLNFRHLFLNFLKIIIIRDGIEKPVHTSKVVCGDIVKIEEGMNIPCDGIVLKATEVKCDESAMTGETDMIKKNTIA